jgi:thiol-disulfide isomerase/thioredoxin
LSMYEGTWWWTSILRGRRLLPAIAVVAAVAAGCGLGAFAADDPDVVLFYREGCHDCARMDEVLAPLEQEFPNLDVLRLDEAANADLLWALSAAYAVLPMAFPVVFVGDQAIVGVGRDKELRLRTAVSDCMASPCPSPLAALEQPRVPWKAILIVGLVLVVLLAVVL